MTSGERFEKLEARVKELESQVNRPNDILLEDEAGSKRV